MYITQEQVGPVIPQALGSLFVSYNLPSYGGDTQTYQAAINQCKTEICNGTWKMPLLILFTIS
jgi:hypothetical protein